MSIKLKELDERAPAFIDAGRMSRVVIDRMEALRLLNVAKEKGFNNRNLSHHVVDMISRDLEAGRWVANGETIVISRDGYPLNGYHRLSAIVRTGVPMATWVCQGVSSELFPTYDNVRRRTASNVLTTAGIKNSARLATAVKMLVVYDQNPHGLVGERDNSLRNTAEILAAVDSYPGLSTLVDTVASHGRKIIEAMISSASVAMGWHVFRRHNREVADDFIEKLCTGADLRQGSPVLTLRTRLQASSVSSAKISQAVKVYFLFRSFQAELRGESLSRLQVPKDNAPMYWPELP